MSETDLQLLARYNRDRAEGAFTEIVRRHLDLVHSAAVRQVRSPQLAEEVAQSVFTDLAHNTRKLKPDTILTAWLYQVTRRTAIDFVRREARRQLREQIATEMNAMNEAAYFAKCADAPEWTHIEPLLDEAMTALDDTDRAAVLLRYFENKSLREVGQTLGTSDDAAQKRVSRAVERLREFFAKRGVTVGAGGLAAVISANAVQAAPVGLAVTISTAAALAGTTIVTTATATATKAIAMTTLQKTIIGATLAAAVGTGIYEAHRVSKVQTQIETLRQRQMPLTDQIQQLQGERDEAMRQLATLSDDNKRLTSNTSELLRLRGEVARLRKDSQELVSSNSTNPALDSSSDPNWKPNWFPMRPFDLGQFPDSATNLVGDLTADVGMETPAALLQTWLWSQRRGDMASRLRTLDFADEETLERYKKVHKKDQSLRPQGSQTGCFERFKLRDMFSVGGDRYLVLIEESSNDPYITVIGSQVFRRIGSEWKVYIPGERK